MIAIYARKSTEQAGVAADQKSITRQVADARAFAAQRGLPAIPDAHVYADDAISGANVQGLRARARLIADVDAGRITTVIMADLSRFSRRDGHEVVAELKQIARKAAVYFYETGERYTFGDIGSNIANYARAESNADYRRKIVTKTRAAMERKARAGHVLTGRCFGYRHVNVMAGDGITRSHVTREIYEPEAAVVREIYQRYAAGQGFKKIADALNRKGTPTPRPRPGRRASWAVSNVRSALRQPLYRGIARWNRLHQHDDDGNPILEINPEAQHITVTNDAWRIVPDAIVAAVEARFADVGRLAFGQRPSPKRTKYLLSGGVLHCPTCGGRFEAMNGTYYVCATKRKSGTSVCANRLSLRIGIFDEAVLKFLDGHVLHPAFIDQVVGLACGNRSDDDRAQVEAQRDTLTAQISRLLALAAAGDVPDELHALVRKYTVERQALIRRLASLAEPPDHDRLRGLLEQRSADWRDRLRSEYPDEARFVVQQLIGSLTLWNGTSKDWATFAPMAGYDPNDRRGKEGIDLSDYGFTAVVTPQGLLNGLGAFEMVAGAGFEPATFGL